MSIRVNDSKGEFLCPNWVYHPELLLDDLSFYMVDIITNLQHIDRRYSLRKAWLGNHLSPFERARVIMQHMDSKPWVSNTGDEFLARLETCLRSDFILEHEDELDHLYSSVLTEVPRINNGYANVEGLQRYLEFRTFFQTVLSLILARVGEEARPSGVNNDDDNLIHHRGPQRSMPGKSSMSSSNSNNNSRCPYWGKYPLGSIMDLPLMQKYRNELKFQPDTVQYAEEPMGDAQLQRYRGQQHPQQQLRHVRFDLEPPQQQLQQPRQEDVNDCCYVEQPTGKTWLERHGITATYEPKPKKRRNPIRRMARKLNMWLCSESGGKYTIRRGGMSGRQDSKGNIPHPIQNRYSARRT
ncbi:hypothetical protein PG993_007426 [Apiospora rasikravindrae]|uniref:Uncharacterized protein n=1 Tax=Apiospora rasikravindrae TaxID=990691 RepID=A0ABR1SXG5_9PEZI